MGKPSEADWRVLDRELRGEAIEILSAAGQARGPRPRLPESPLPFCAVEAILSGFQVILSVVLIVLILLHSGKDAGLSGAFGVGTGAGPFGGGSLVERNLNRWTVAFACCSSRTSSRCSRSEHGCGARPITDRAAPARRPVKRTSRARIAGHAWAWAKRRP